MSEPTPASPLGRVLVTLALPSGATLALGLGVLLGTHAASLAEAISPATQVDALVVLAVTALGAVLAAWFGLHLLLGAVCVLGAATGRRWRAGERVLVTHGPVLVRRGVALALGASLGLGGLSVATATSTAPVPDLGWVPPTGVEVAPVDQPSESLEPGDEEHTEDSAAEDGHTDGEHTEAVPDGELPMPVPETSPTDATSTPPSPRTVVVDAGDSLWSLTSALLGEASDAEVAAAWPALYEENRELVGDEPDLIYPGQELTVPTILEEQR
ncbi:MAG: hypothetical protein M3Y20_05465 [Actinomycetota bacterium]|nr:hypothetical protein [Actinomycetota bacterium]